MYKDLICDNNNIKREGQRYKEIVFAYYLMLIQNRLFEI